MISVREWRKKEIKKDEEKMHEVSDISGKNFSLSSFQVQFLYLLRILAAESVCFGHAFGFFQLTPLKDQSHFAYIQNIGVVIFLILSGFLLSCSVSGKDRNGQYHFWQFLVNRAVRIGCCYVPALCLVFLIDFIAFKLGRYAYGPALNLRHFFGNLLMMQDMPVTNFGLNRITSFGSDRPLWVLSIEWWIYMAFGYLFLHIKHKAEKNAVSFSDLIFTAALIFFPLFAFSGRGNGLALLWLLGSGVYFLLPHIRISGCKKMLLLILSFCASAFLLSYKKEAYRMDVFVALVMLFLSILLLGESEHGKESGPFSRFSTALLKFYSGTTFSLYLLHYPILDLFYSHMGDWHLSNTGAFWTSILCAHITAVLFAIPFEQKSRKLERPLIDALKKVFR